jgi:hypothetical protein
MNAGFPFTTSNKDVKNGRAVAYNTRRMLARRFGANLDVFRPVLKSKFQNKNMKSRSQFIEGR